MKEGDILIYVGEDTPDLKRGDRVFFKCIFPFSQNLSTNTYDDTVIYTHKEKGEVHYRVYPSSSFKLLTQIRDEKIDTLL